MIEDYEQEGLGYNYWFFGVSIFLLLAALASLGAILGNLVGLWSSTVLDNFWRTFHVLSFYFPGLLFAASQALLHSAWLHAFVVLSFAVLPLVTLNGIFQILLSTPSKFHLWFAQRVSPAVSLWLLSGIFVIQVLFLLHPAFRGLLLRLGKRALCSFRGEYPEEELEELSPNLGQKRGMMGPELPELGAQSGFAAGPAFSRDYEVPISGANPLPDVLQKPDEELLQPSRVPQNNDSGAYSPKASAEFQSEDHQKNEPNRQDVDSPDLPPFPPDLQGQQSSDLPEPGQEENYALLEQELIESAALVKTQDPPKREESQKAEPKEDGSPFELPIEPVPDSWDDHQAARDSFEAYDPGFDILATDVAASSAQEPVQKPDPVQLVFEHANLERPPFFTDSRELSQSMKEMKADLDQVGLDEPYEPKEAVRQEKILLRIQEADEELADEEMADELLQREQAVGDWRASYSEQIALPNGATGDEPQIEEVTENLEETAPGPEQTQTAEAVSGEPAVEEGYGEEIPPELMFEAPAFGETPLPSSVETTLADFEEPVPAPPIFEESEYAAEKFAEPQEESVLPGSESIRGAEATIEEEVELIFRNDTEPAQTEVPILLEAERAADSQMPPDAESEFPDGLSGELSGELPGEFSAPGKSLAEDFSVAEAAEQALREKREEESAQKMLVPQVRQFRAYQAPVSSLIDYDPEAEQRNAQIDPETEEAGEALLQTLKKFKISAQMTHILKGPSITEFGILPAPGIKLNRVEQLADNLAMELAARSIRIVAPIPGKKAVGIEIPNRRRSTVSFPALMDSPDMQRASRQMQLPIVLGKEINGEIQIADLRQMPHLLIAGATGSGKSVCVNVIINSLILSRTPQALRLLMIDPKIVELKQYNDIPHLLTPVVVDARRALQALQWVSSEMERRYALLDAIGAGNKGIESYNRYIAEKKMALLPLEFIVVIVDEFADLMSLVGKELEGMVARLAAMSRAVGIHLVLATQRPSVDVVTGLIKANFPTRIAFMVASQTDSRTILDQKGAEQLLGQGDMLFSFPGHPLLRIQGAYLAEDEAERISSHIKTLGEPVYLDEIIFEEDDENDTHALESGSDELYPQAVEIALQAGEISTSFLQRRLSIGYNRAARIIDEMEARGVIGPAQGSKKREVLQAV